MRLTLEARGTCDTTDNQAETRPDQIASSLLSIIRCTEKAASPEPCRTEVARTPAAGTHTVMVTPCGERFGSRADSLESNVGYRRREGKQVLVFRRLFRSIDDDNLGRHSRRFQLQAELFLDGRE